MKYIIKNFTNEGDKKLVGFMVVDEAGNKLAIDKRVPATGTDEEIIAAAQQAAQPEIDAWQAQFAVVGRVWDAETNSFVPEPEPVEESNEEQE